MMDSHMNDTRPGTRSDIRGAHSDIKTAIRPLSEKDIPAAAALIRQVFDEFEAPEYARQGIETFHRFIAPEALATQLRSGAMQAWGALRGERLTGVVAITRRNHISLLFVDKSCHRQGIARALFAVVRDLCRTAPELSRITVNSSPYAVAVYRRLGFIPTSAEQTVDGIRFTPMEYLL